MQRSIYFVWALLAASTKISAQQSAVPAASLIDRAKLYISFGMFDNAKQVLTAALAENEFDPAAHFLIGGLWMEDKDWMQARKEFHIAFNIQPMGFSAAGRLSIAVANAFYRSGDRALRVEALQYSNTYLQRPQVDGADPFENSATLEDLGFGSKSRGRSSPRAFRELVYWCWIGIHFSRDGSLWCIQDPCS
jgi:tetratricopeptide (TPR) repeat protein